MLWRLSLYVVGSVGVLGFRVPPCLNTETYAHTFEDKPHDCHLSFVSKDTVQRKSQAASCAPPFASICLYFLVCSSLLLFLLNFY